MEIVTVAALAVIAASNLCCFALGAKIGQAAKNGERIEAPEVNPVKAIREMGEKRQLEKEQQREALILQNIENYNGTGMGQADVPR